MFLFLLTFGSWWGNLSGTQQIFWAIAVVASVLFLIQFVFSIIGVDLDADADIEMDTDITDTGYSLDADFSMFSMRSIISFFTFFGWTGVLVLNAGGTTMNALIASTAAGTAAMLLVAYMMWQFAKLSQDGTADITTALFQTGEVYLTIPANNTGKGKVHITVQGALKELDAITEEKRSIPTGAFIRVVEVMKDNILMVEPVDK